MTRSARTCIRTLVHICTVFEGHRQAVGMLNPLRNNNEGTCGGEETTPVTTACPEAGEYIKMSNKTKNMLLSVPDTKH